MDRAPHPLGVVQLAISRSGIAYKPGPPINQITPRDRSNGSVPPWHTYDVYELPHYHPDTPVAFITRYDRKGNTVDVRLLKNE